LKPTPNSAKPSATDRRVRHDPAQARRNGHSHYAAESMTYRVVGMIESLLEGFIGHRRRG
jgi:hypothetical protein